MQVQSPDWFDKGLRQQHAHQVGGAARHRLNTSQVPHQENWVLSSVLAACHNSHGMVHSMGHTEASLACCVHWIAVEPEVILVCVSLLWQGSALTGGTQPVPAADRKVHHSNFDAEMILCLMYACSSPPYYLCNDDWCTNPAQTELTCQHEKAV